MTPLLCAILGLAAPQAAVCLELHVAAIHHGEPVAEVIAQAWVESRLSYPRGPYRGPLQVGRFFPGEPVAAGMRARKVWRTKRGADWLCAYQAGYRYRGGGCRYEQAIRAKEAECLRKLAEYSAPSP